MKAISYQQKSENWPIYSSKNINKTFYYPRKKIRLKNQVKATIKDKSKKFK